MGKCKRKKPSQATREMIKAGGYDGRRAQPLSFQHGRNALRLRLALIFHNEDLGLPERGFTVDELSILTQWPWPGNLTKRLESWTRAGLFFPSSVYQVGREVPSWRGSPRLQGWLIWHYAEIPDADIQRALADISQGVQLWREMQVAQALRSSPVHGHASIPRATLGPQLPALPTYGERRRRSLKVLGGSPFHSTGRHF
jgi:hypothetical protein